jgi:hypothetical protein
MPSTSGEEAASMSTETPTHISGQMNRKSNTTQTMDSLQAAMVSVLSDWERSSPSNPKVDFLVLYDKREGNILPSSSFFI